MVFFPLIRFYHFVKGRPSTTGSCSIPRLVLHSAGFHFHARHALLLAFAKMPDMGHKLLIVAPGKCLPDPKMELSLP